MKKAENIISKGTAKARIGELERVRRKIKRLSIGEKEVGIAIRRARKHSS